MASLSLSPSPSPPSQCVHARRQELVILITVAPQQTSTQALLCSRYTLSAPDIPIQSHADHRCNFRSLGQGVQIPQESLEFREAQEEQLRYASVQQQRSARSAETTSLPTCARNIRFFPRARRVVQFGISKPAVEVFTSTQHWRTQDWIPQSWLDGRRPERPTKRSRAADVCREYPVTSRNDQQCGAISKLFDFAYVIRLWSQC